MYTLTVVQMRKLAKSRGVTNIILSPFRKESIGFKKKNTFRSRFTPFGLSIY